MVGGGGPTSSSDIQTSRKRSKSLPELESIDEGSVDEAMERPASAEGAMSDMIEESTPPSSSSSSSSLSSSTSTSTEKPKLHSRSDASGDASSTSGSHQRGRLYSTPNMLGTVPLSHSRSTPSKCSAPFAVPRVNYGSMHRQYGTTMYPNFAAGYQSYSAPPNMPTGSAYTPTYNPYSTTTGSSYIGAAGPSGAALYNPPNSRLPLSTYTNNHPSRDMLNYGLYPTPDTRQGSSMSSTYTSLPPPPPSYLHSSPSPQMMSTSNTYVTSNNSIDNSLSHNISMTISTGMECDQASAAVGTQVHPTSSNSVLCIQSSSPSEDLLHCDGGPLSTTDISHSPITGAENGCDSTTCSDAAAPTEHAEGDNVSASDTELDASCGREDVAIHYYTTR